MFKKGDRVKEKNNLGIVTAIHTPGTVDVLFDGDEYAIRRQDYDVTLIKENPMRKRRNKAHLKLVKPKSKSKRVKKLSQSMRDKLSKSDFIFPKRRSFPIPDIGHGRLALQYGQFPNNRKNLQTIKKVVFKRYPSLIKWWNSHHPEDRWTSASQSRRKMVANPSSSRWKMKKSTQNGQIVYIVSGRVRRGPKVFYTLKNAQDFLDRRKRD